VSDADRVIPHGPHPSGTSRERAVRRLVVARFASIARSMAASVALIDLIYRRTDGSSTLLAVTSICTMGAAGLFAPFGGLIADRWNRRKVMIASDVAGAALYLALAFTQRVWAILALALLTAIASTPFRAASTAAIPALVGDDSQIARANGRLALGSNLGLTLGPAFGGVLVQSNDARWVFVINAASFLISAAVVASDTGAVRRCPRAAQPEHSEQAV
jgi:MFS family permease